MAFTLPRLRRLYFESLVLISLSTHGRAETNSFRRATAMKKYGTWRALLHDRFKTSRLPPVGSSDALGVCVFIEKSRCVLDALGFLGRTGSDTKSSAGGAERQ